jgi:catechol 2,3-dioxygenase-like lactoylglutathione lyase family enzyme
MHILSNRFQAIARSITGKRFSRRQFIATSSYSIIGSGTFLGALSACSPSSDEEEQQAVEQAPPEITAEQGTEEQQQSKIRRIKMGTIGCRDLPATEDWYSNWIGYSVVERGEISAELAGSWGTPNMAGRAYFLMQPESGTDVYIRAVETDGVDGYSAMTTYGWNSFEIIVEDVYKLNDRMLNGPFEIIGGPEPIFPESTIHAMQVIGPSEEVLYLTMETDAEATRLPEPASFVDRPFIMVLACPDPAALVDFYSTRLGVPGRARSGAGFAIGIIARAQGLPEDHKFQMGGLSLADHGNSIEVDGYPDSATFRPRAEGQLPPGNAMCSFNVNDLDEFDVDFISSPVTDSSLAYGDHRTATFIGPAGELTELIEAPG